MSTASWVSFLGGPPTDFAYPRVIEQELLRAGQPVVVRNLAVIADSVRRGLKSWEAEVFAWSPDVVVLDYGYYEMVHLFIPRPLERHAQSLAGRPGRLRHAYRRLMLRPIWLALAKVQQRLAPLAPPVLVRRRVARVTDDLEQLIRQIQLIGSPTVLLVELTTPGEKWQAWFPGIADRLEQVNRALAEVVRRIDRPNVRLFSTSTALAPLVAAGEDLVPDGAHYTAAAHRAIGTALAKEISAELR